MSVQPASSRFSVGDRLGPYALLGRLDQGSVGEVWLAERTSEIASTQLAIKLPFRGVATLEEIRREGELWVRSANHPNVLPLFEANVYDGQIVLASEYAPDGSLDTWLVRNGATCLPLRTAVPIILGVLAGLDHLHGRGVVHRDLKPSNVLMQGETPKLADFGLARAVTLDGSTWRAAGTPFYMAPEAFDGMRSTQTDIWSAGILCYQLLSGQLPFSGTELAPLLAAIRAGDFSPLPASVPQAIQAVVRRALQKMASGRYASAAEMSDDLQRAVHQLGAEAMRVLLPDKAPASRREDGAFAPQEAAPVEPAARKSGARAPGAEVATGGSATTTWQLELEQTPTSWQLDLRRVGEITVIEVRSHLLTEDRSKAFYDRLKELIGGGNERAVLNLRRVEHIDSLGLSALLTLNKCALVAGGALRLCCLQPSLQEALRQCRLNLILGVDSTEEAAVAVLQGNPDRRR